MLLLEALNVLLCTYVQVLTADSDDDIDRSNTMKKKEKEMSEAEQQTYKEDMQGQSYKLSKGAESEREKSTKRPPTGAWLLYIHLYISIVRILSLSLASTRNYNLLIWFLHLVYRLMVGSNKNIDKKNKPSLGSSAAEDIRDKKNDIRKYAK